MSSFPDKIVLCGLVGHLSVLHGIVTAGHSCGVGAAGDLQKCCMFSYPNLS